MGDDDENIEKLNEDGHEDKDRGEETIKNEETDIDNDENDEIKSVKDEIESVKDENEFDKTEEKEKVLKSTLHRKKSSRKKQAYDQNCKCYFFINPIPTERGSPPQAY